MLQLPTATVLDPLGVIQLLGLTGNQLAIGLLQHRASACYWNGQMFSLLAHAAYSDFKADDAHSLHLQINAVTAQTVSGPDDSPFTIANEFQTFPLVDSVPNGTRILTAMAAGDLGAACAFWLLAPANGAPGVDTLYAFTPSIDASGAVSTPWDQSKVFSATVPGLERAGIADFACTSVGSTVYFACSAPQGGAVSLFSYREGTFSAAVSLDLGVDHIVSLDLTAITVPTAGAQAAPSGSAPLQQQLALVALTGGQSGLICRLITPAQADALIAGGQLPAPASLPLPAAPGAMALELGPGPMISKSSSASNQPNILSMIAGGASAIRACWGTARSDSGDPISNGLLLAHIAVMPFSTGSTAHMTVVDLDTKAAFAWSDITFQNTSTYLGNLSTLFPIAVANSFGDGSKATASYSAIFAACVWSKEAYPVGPAVWVAQVVPSHKLTLGGAQQSFGSGPQTDDDALDAAVSSWLLLGVVTGLPPYPVNAKSGGIKLSFGQSSKSGASASVTSKKSGTFGAEGGGEVFSLGGSVTSAVSGENETGSTWSISVDYSWTNGKDADPDTGWLIVAQPNYAVQPYSMTTWSGAATGITLNVLWSTSASLAYYPFKLSAPNTPHPHSDRAILERLCSFPEADRGAVSWPQSSDVAGWSELTIDTLGWGLSDYSGEGSELQTVEMTASGSQQIAIVSGTDLKLTTGSEVTIDVEAGLDLGVVSFKASGEYAVEHSVTNSFTTDNSFGIECEQLTPARSPKEGYNDVSVQPYLYQCIKDNAPWVPTIFGRQRPWLLTWRVTRAIAGS